MDAERRGFLIILIGALVALLAQIIIAPNIVIFSAMPNFIVAYVLVAAMVWPKDSTVVLAFVLGLLFDLLGYGPVGSMALLLTVFAFVIMRVFTVIDLSNLFMPIVVFIVAALCVELFYSIILLILGLAPGFIDALIYRTLPSILLDCIVGVIFYPLLRKLLSTDPLKPSGSNKNEFKRSSRKTRRYR